MSEIALRQLFSERLGRHGVVRRVENPIDPGFPDFVCCFRGHVNMVEAKYLDRMPTRASARIKISSLTLEQVTWAEEWARAGGAAWLLLQAGRSFYALVDIKGMRAIHEGDMTEAQLKREAAWTGARLTTSILKPMLGR